jgi:hypothetical protein
MREVERSEVAVEVERVVEGLSRVAYPDEIGAAVEREVDREIAKREGREVESEVDSAYRHLAAALAATRSLARALSGIDRREVAAEIALAPESESGLSRVEVEAIIRFAREVESVDRLYLARGRGRGEVAR